MSDKIVIDEKEIEGLQRKYNVQPIKPYPKIEDFKRLNFMQLEEITPEKIEYVFEPCLPVQGIAFIYAATGVGKTLFALNLAYAIAGGGSFLKYSCPKPRKVLYVDGEMAFTQIHGRLMQIAERQGELDFKENLLLMTPDKVLPNRMPKIDEEEGQYLYKEIMLKDEIEVVIFDNVSVLSSIDENSSHEWKIVQDWILHLRSLGKSVIVIHHAGKNKEEYRGTSKMLDCMDVAISLQTVIDDVLEDDKEYGRKIKVVYKKARVFGGKDALSYEVTFKEGFWNFQSIEKTEMDLVIEKTCLKINQHTIAKELGCSQSKVAKLVMKARKLGILQA
jgi:hypothetical protein